MHIQLLFPLYPKSCSSRLVMGRVTAGGTGMIDIVQNVNNAQPAVDQPDESYLYAGDNEDW